MGCDSRPDGLDGRYDPVDYKRGGEITFGSTFEQAGPMVIGTVLLGRVAIFSYQTKGQLSQQALPSFERVLTEAFGEHLARAIKPKEYL